MGSRPVSEYGVTFFRWGVTFFRRYDDVGVVKTDGGAVTLQGEGRR